MGEERGEKIVIWSSTCSSHFTNGNKNGEIVSDTSTQTLLPVMMTPCHLKFCIKTTRLDQDICKTKLRHRHYYEEVTNLNGSLNTQKKIL